MRDILFRGKCTDGGGWVHGSYIECKLSWHHRHPHKAWIITDARSNGGWFAIARRYPVVNDTVGQYTGLKDKDGTMIFEGDILRMDGFTPDVCEVRFIEGAFCLVFPEPGPAWPVDIHYVQHADKPKATVIGNIYDNPELMEGNSLCDSQKAEPKP